MSKQETKTETTPAATKPKGKIVCDPELIAMNRINRILQALPEKARIRTIQWLKDKIDFPIIPETSDGNSRPH
jgi:hypothetical protein